MIFIIDVSYNMMKSGLVHLLCQNMRDIIRNLPKEDGAEQSYMKVGFITYNTSVHFYNIKVGLCRTYVGLFLRLNLSVRLTF